MNKHAPIAQRIEQLRPKEKMMVQFRLGVLWKALKHKNFKTLKH